MKTLVAYFSASGTTKMIANRLAGAIGADIFEIEPKIPYSNQDLDWTNKNSRSSLEMNDRSSRPEVAKKVSNMEQYDKIFVGFPIWWYVAPTIINSFLEQYDLSGKILIPFSNSQKGKEELSYQISQICEKSRVLPGIVISQRMTEKKKQNIRKLLQEDEI